MPGDEKSTPKFDFDVFQPAQRTSTGRITSSLTGGSRSLSTGDGEMAEFRVAILAVVCLVLIIYCLQSSGGASSSSAVGPSGHRSYLGAPARSDGYVPSAPTTGAQDPASLAATGASSTFLLGLLMYSMFGIGNGQGGGQRRF